MKKWTSMLLVFCLALSLAPWQGVNVAKAATEYFAFPGEQYNVTSPRTVLTDRVNLTGSINNVIGTSVSYSVEQITYDGVEEKPTANANMNQTANMELDGTSLKVYNVQLFPGLNRITFNGMQGFTPVSSSIYIEYRNSPTLYDLQARMDNNTFEIRENGTTVVYSNASRNRQSHTIAVTGKAPNAQEVTVAVKSEDGTGGSWTYTVSSANGWNFAASPVTVKKGKNTITIRVKNNNQYVETTREIAFYNGEVTFYDLKLDDGSATMSLGDNPNFSTSGGNLVVKGKAILPLNVTSNDDNNNGTIEENEYYLWPDPNNLQAAVGNSAAQGGAGIDISLNGATPVPAANVQLVGTASRTDSFITVEFETASLGTPGDASLAFDQQHRLQLRGANYVRTAAGALDVSNDVFFRLRNGGTPYIYEINYLPGLTADTTESQLEPLTGSPLHGTNLSSLPAGVELLIGNSSGNPVVELTSVAPVTGSPVTPVAGDFTQLDPPSALYVTRTIDGADVQFRRVFVRIDRLPTSGTQTLTFTVGGGNSETATVNLLYGPFVKYTRLVDNQQINFDTTRSDGQAYILGVPGGDPGQLDGLRGQLLNISNPADIRYENDGANLQTVFFYINNVEIKLEPDGADVTKFKIKDDEYSKAYESIYKGGDNQVRFVFRSGRNNYQRDTKFTVIPTNLPEIPAKNTAGVFPYSANRDTPLPNDPNFELQGTVYMTKEAKMNVYGTFDFIDLGTSKAAVDAKLNTLGVEKANYILKIESAGQTTTWTLNNRFTSAGTPAELLNESGVVNNDIEVTYDYTQQSFAFLLRDQSLPEDGSSRVYTISVYNNGETGPKAQYRLEVDPISIPYTILAPIQEKRIMNQNYVEVIIHSPGADRVVVDGVEARRMLYLDYGTLTNGQPTQIDAFSALITGLRANRESEIEFTIIRGEDELEDAFTVRYTPENIPGGQVMDQMKTNFKLFNGALTLRFPSGTNLIRTDYNTPENLKGQVYAGHNLLFAIANPYDGVIDRHDFESIPADYDLSLDLGEVYFTASFPDRFIKTGPVYWIDGGQADDALLTPNEYDPITSGIDPYPLSYEEGVSRMFYYDRDPARELVPSKRGQLTLQYNGSVTENAGTVITVFRFDPFAKQWENIGGVVNARNNTITVPFDRFGYYTVGKLSYGFNDITDHPYAREAAETIYSKGVMNAIDPSGAFGTDIYITRGEFARMIVRAMELPLNFEGNKHFVDVPDTGNAISMDAIWDYRYIETAARAGIIKGTQPRVFEPDNQITRQDAMVMLAKAMELKLDTDLAKVRADLQKAFTDEAKISTYAKPSVSAVLKKKLVSGSPVNRNDPASGFVFEPDARLLRSDAAILIARVMADGKKLPSIYAPKE